MNQNLAESLKRHESQTARRVSVQEVLQKHENILADLIQEVVRLRSIIEQAGLSSSKGTDATPPEGKPHE